MRNCPHLGPSINWVARRKGSSDPQTVVVWSFRTLDMRYRIIRIPYEDLELGLKAIKVISPSQVSLRANFEFLVVSGILFIGTYLFA